MPSLRPFAVALLALAAARPAAAQGVADATVVDGDTHRVALDNEHVRVITAMAPLGRKSAMHSHPPLVLVSLGTGRARLTLPDGSKPLLDLRPGTVLWVPATQHAWEVLAGEINVVAVEVKAAKAPAQAAAAAK